MDSGDKAMDAGMTDHSFRFGVQAHQARDGAAWTAQAQRAEELGYSTLLVMDHFGDQLGPVPAMTAASEATTELRVGSLVFDNDYRHPVTLAKDIATVDLLSGGRVEFGLGAGWMASDYDESGIQFDSAGVRIDRLEEAIAIFKGLWTPGHFSHDGDHYRIANLDGTPKPVQQPHPPLLIGGGGNRMLGIAAREADIVGINPKLGAGSISPEAARDSMADAVDAKVDRVSEAAGDRFDDIELSVFSYAVVVTDDRHAVTDHIAGRFGVAAADIDAMPYVLVGSAGEIADDLRRFRDRWGITYFSVMVDAMEPFAAVVDELAGT